MNNIAGQILFLNNASNRVGVIRLWKMFSVTIKPPRGEVLQKPFLWISRSHKQAHATSISGSPSIGYEDPPLDYQNNNGSSAGSKYCCNCSGSRGSGKFYMVREITAKCSCLRGNGEGELRNACKRENKEKSFIRPVLNAIELTIKLRQLQLLFPMVTLK